MNENKTLLNVRFFNKGKTISQDYGIVCTGACNSECNLKNSLKIAGLNSDVKNNELNVETTRDSAGETYKLAKECARFCTACKKRDGLPSKILEVNQK